VSGVPEVSEDPAREAADYLLRTAPPMVVLRPGDRVLVAFTDEPDQDTTNTIAGSLRRTFPGVDFTVLTGVASIAVASGR
jgi:hypothetical protein